jgi:imidazolonepropionase-like amidohydrolase
VSLPPDVEVEDVGDRTIMPGMIDAHVHMLSTGSAVSGDESRAQTGRTPRPCSPAREMHCLR